MTEKTTDQTVSAPAAQRKPFRRVHWVLTLIYGAVLMLSVPFAMRSLLIGPSEGVPETAFFFMNLSVAAIPFTIALSLVAVWMYHRGGAQRTAFIPYAFLPLNILVVLMLRAML